MDNECFMNKISCEFAIITHDMDCHIVTKELNITPDRYFNKGDSVSSKHSARTGTRPHGLWAIASKVTINEEVNLSEHLEYFQKVLSSKLDPIQKLKGQYGFECIFAISIETEDAGVGFDLNELNLSFINKISNRFSCSFIAKESVRN